MAAGIEVQNLSFSYESGTQALTDVSFNIGPGETVALLGHNGSGKSTLVRHFNGLLLPEQGEVKINGISTAGKSVASLAAQVGLLFQNPDDQICKSSVWEEVTFGPRNLGYPEELIQELGEGQLASFGLLEMRKRNPHDLGDSERKRLAIASVLAMDTGITVLDEPTAGLDPQETAMLSKALQSLQAAGKTVIIISHDMDFVAENSSRALCLQDGRLCFDGSTVDLFNGPAQLDLCGLLPPQVVRLSSHFGLNLSELTPQGFISRLLGS
ncbi:energy-coupling factor ABC transporter ATP-binding protein [Maridesulfovibrio sp. FT414]|uniref:energy-coupling factor ABC transporter ATP-binding protein n=1 Tax=Maridesulfovibrio sp. FT414 TaxID=2979469 RepID=UPI003D8078BA